MSDKKKRKRKKWSGGRGGAFIYFRKVPPPGALGKGKVCRQVSKISQVFRGVATPVPAMCT
jgi:hypothetical protein